MTTIALQIAADAQALTLDFTQPITRTEKFEEFHRANPHVLTNLEALADKLIRRGQTHIGIGYLFEILRYESFMRTEDTDSDFKLNNNYRSRYARILLERHPEWSEVISVRNLRSL